MIVGAGLGCIRVRGDAAGMAVTMFQFSITHASPGRHSVGGKLCSTRCVSAGTLQQDHSLGELLQGTSST